MQFHDYQILARSTAIYPDLGNNLYYPTLGLCGEVSEIADKLNNYEHEFYNNDESFTKGHIEALTKEVGDVLWYISNIASEADISLSKLTGVNQINDFLHIVIDNSHENQYNQAIKYYVKLSAKAGIIPELIKKIYRDDSGILTEERKLKLETALLLTIASLVDLCQILNISLDSAATININKLQRRQQENKIHGSGDNR